jgi:hypothetical protein
VNENLVDTAVAVLKGMHENESVGDGGGMGNGGDSAILHHLESSEEARHQFREVGRSRADMVNGLFLIGTQENCLRCLRRGQGQSSKTVFVT